MKNLKEFRFIVKEILSLIFKIEKELCLEIMFSSD